MNHAIGPAVVRAFRRAALPLAWYYAVTLGLPLANGAAQAGAAFVEHALAVLVLPPVLIVLACVIREIAHVLTESAESIPAGPNGPLRLMKSLVHFTRV
jgi:hypothetical protein